MPTVALSFFLAYFAGVYGLIWFDVRVLGLADPELQTAETFLFMLWSALYFPMVVSAALFLRRSHRTGAGLWRLAALYLALIFAALEASFILDANWIVLLLQLPVLSWTFHLLGRTKSRIAAGNRIQQQE